MKRTWVLAFLAATTMAGFVFLVLGEDAAKPAGVRKPKETRNTAKAPADDLWQITAVDAASNTFTAARGDTTRTLKVTESTTVKTNNVPAALGDVKVGMNAYLAIGLDPTVASQLLALDTPKVPAKPVENKPKNTGKTKGGEGKKKGEG